MLLVSKKKADCAYIRHTMKLLSFYGICEIGNKVFVQVFQWKSIKGGKAIGVYWIS